MPEASRNFVMHSVVQDRKDRGLDTDTWKFAQGRIDAINSEVQDSIRGFKQAYEDLRLASTARNAVWERFITGDEGLMASCGKLKAM